MSHSNEGSAQTGDVGNSISYDEWKQQMGPSSGATSSVTPSGPPHARRGRPRKNPILPPPAPVNTSVDDKKSHKHHSKHKKKRHKHSSSRSPDGEHKHEKKHKRHKKSHGHSDETREKHKKKHKKKHHPADEDLAQIREAGAAAAAASIAETKPPKQKTIKKPHQQKNSQSSNSVSPEVSVAHPPATELSLLDDEELSESALDAEAAHIAANFTPFPGRLPRPPSSISLSTGLPPEDEGEEDFPFVDDSDDEDYVAGAYPPKFKKYKSGASTSKLSGI